MSFTAKKWCDFAERVGEEKANRIQANFDAVWGGLDRLLEDVNNTASETALRRMNAALEVIGARIGLYKSGTKEAE